MGELLERLKKEYREEGMGEPFKGEIKSALKYLYGIETKDNGETEGWLIDSNGTKIRHITEQEFNTIRKFALTGT